MIYWIEFFVLAGIIFITGKNLIYYGDILAEKLNIGKTVIGIVLVASVTSLPELITGLSAAIYVDSPDMVAGEIFGSCMANLFILALLDFFVKDQPLTTKVHYGFTLSSAFGIILIVIASLGIIFKNYIPSIGWINFISLLIILIYIIAIKMVTSYEKRLITSIEKKVAEKLVYKDIQLKIVITKYSMNALFIVIAATFLPDIGYKITKSFGFTETFFGSLFIAISTSLPELAVSIAGIKLNLIPIAVANLLGSNIFNIFIMAIIDIFYIKGSIYSYMNISNIILAMFSILMTSIVIVGLIYKAERKFFRLAYESTALIIIYMMGMYIIFTFK